MENVLFSWSGGKDSALALHEITRTRSYNVVSLLTTLSQDYDRISMHGVRRALLEQQAAALGFPLEKVFIPKAADNKVYEAQMAQVLARYKNEGITGVVFGDIFLEDLRKYREDKLATLALKGFFPLWKKDTREVAHSLVTSGFKTIVTCIDIQVLGKEFVGRVVDERFLAELPPDVDPAGENGEYHSFVYDGPIFKNPVSFETGEIVLREERFYFCDLVPTAGQA